MRTRYVLVIAVSSFALGVAGAYVLLGERLQQSSAQIESVREIVLKQGADIQRVRALEDLKATVNVMGMLVAAQKAGTPGNALSSDLSRYLSARIQSVKDIPASNDPAFSKNAKFTIDKGEQLLEDIKWAY